MEGDNMLKNNLINKDVRIKEFLKHIDTYGTIDGMTTTNLKLYQSIIHFDDSLLSLANELGLKWENISNFAPTNYYKDFNNLESKVTEFINKFGRFPKKMEMVNDLGIQQRNIDFHGGIYEIKRKMNYDSVNDLVDDNGFINNSLLEYKVAQFLINNKISYKREQHPFPKSEGQFRSDFMIQTNDDITFHVELWGFSETDGKGMTRIYNKKKDIKLRLYEKYNINLISLEYDEMYRLNLTKLQKYLINKFSILKDYEIRFIDNEYLVSPKNLTDEEILVEIMKYSKDENILPTQNTLIKNGLFYYVSEIRQRHDSYLSFAKRFNKTLRARSNEWDEETVYQEMLNLINKGIPLERQYFREHKLGGLTSFIKNSKKPIHFYKINFYNMYLNQIDIIPDKEIDYLRNVSVNRGSNIMNKVTPEQQEQAKWILEKYNSKTTY
jgi:hypothetical protein